MWTFSVCNYLPIKTQYWMKRFFPQHSALKLTCLTVNSPCFLWTTFIIYKNRILISCTTKRKFSALNERNKVSYFWILKSNLLKEILDWLIVSVRNDSLYTFPLWYIHSSKSHSLYFSLLHTRRNDLTMLLSRQEAKIKSEKAQF